MKSRAVVGEEPRNDGRQVGPRSPRDVGRSTNILVVDYVLPHRDDYNRLSHDRGRRRTVESPETVVPRPRQPVGDSADPRAAKVRLSEPHAGRGDKTASQERRHAREAILCREMASDISRRPIGRQRVGVRADFSQGLDEESPFRCDLLGDHVTSSVTTAGTSRTIVTARSAPDGDVARRRDPTELGLSGRRADVHVRRARRTTSGMSGPSEPGGRVRGHGRKQLRAG